MPGPDAPDRRPPAGNAFYLATFGCQMNAYDSARLADRLTAAGFTPVDDPRRAGVILVNTCSVRERPEQKVHAFLAGLQRLKRESPRLVIGVGGCVAQQLGAALLDQVPHLDLVFGPDALGEVPRLIAEARAGRRQALCPEPRGFGGLALPAAPAARPAGLKAFLTVMQGCDNFCSYCVVPYLRGRERSRPVAEILAEAAGLVAAGVRELRLLGQNVNSYRDPASGLDFPGLLARVAEVPGLLRLRFATSHPKDLSEGLIAALAELPRVMEEIHLPPQSGSDPILKAMNRRYTRAEYLARVARLRERVPGVGLGGDVIVGFPGESEADFQATLALLREVRFGFLYSFKYSDRPHAKATALPGKLPEEVKARRLAELQALQAEISLANHRGLVGTIEKVLVEGPAKRGAGLLTGRGRAGRAVNFPGPAGLEGRLVAVEVTEGRVNSLLGRLVDRPEGERR